MGDKKYTLTEDEPMMAAEPATAMLNESVNNIGLLRKVMKLNSTDKIALINILKQDTRQDDPFKTDDCGQIVLPQEMRDAAHKAEQDYEDGKCLTEEQFKQRFAKWL